MLMIEDSMQNSNWSVVTCAGIYKARVAIRLDFLGHVRGFIIKLQKFL